MPGEIEAIDLPRFGLLLDRLNSFGSFGSVGLRIILEYNFGEDRGLLW